MLDKTTRNSVPSMCSFTAERTPVGPVLNHLMMAMMALANKGLVVVTFNYRIGVFGFLSTPALSQESRHNSSGNYGLLDMIAALKWVQRNIEAFGGDPTQVTIGGGSSGAGSCLHLSLSPLAKGLFRAAVVESGGTFFTRDPEISGQPTSYRNLSVAEQAGLEYLAGRNISASTTLAELRNLPTQQLVAPLTLDTVIDHNVTLVSWHSKPSFFRPVLDGHVFARTYQQTLDDGLQNDVAIMTGCNHDEWGATPSQVLSLETYRTTARAKYGNMSDEFLTLYPAKNDVEAGEAKNQAVRDNSRTSTYLWSQQWLKNAKKPVYTYFWTHVPPDDGQIIPRGKGAAHGSEVPYPWNNLHTKNASWTPEDHKVAETLSNYLVNFVTNGDPNGPNVPEWPKCDGQSAAIMELGQNYKQIPVAGPADAKIGFLRRFYATQPVW